MVGQRTDLAPLRFGNATTVRNNNSSRFGRLIKMYIKIENYKDPAANNLEYPVPVTFCFYHFVNATESVCVRICFNLLGPTHNVLLCYRNQKFEFTRVWFELVFWRPLLDKHDEIDDWNWFEIAWDGCYLDPNATEHKEAIINGIKYSFFPCLLVSSQGNVEIVRGRRDAVFAGEISSAWCSAIYRQTSRGLISQWGIYIERAAQCGFDNFLVKTGARFSAVSAPNFASKYWVFNEMFCTKFAARFEICKIWHIWKHFVSDNFDRFLSQICCFGWSSPKSLIFRLIFVNVLRSGWCKSAQIL